MKREGGEKSCLYMCLGACNSPSSCPHNGGSPPTMGAHTSPGLHLVGLERQRRTENQ